MIKSNQPEEAGEKTLLGRKSHFLLIFSLFIVIILFGYLAIKFSKPRMSLGSAHDQATRQENGSQNTDNEEGIINPL